MTIKFNSGTSTEMINAFALNYNLELEGVSPLGYYDYIAVDADPFTVGEQILQSEIISDLNILSKKFFLGKITDVGGGGGNCTQWYLDLTDAWNITKGVSSVKVAVIDGGINYNNIDLGMGTVWTGGAYSNLFENPGELGVDANNNPKNANGVDDDNNGFIDDYRGWNFFNSDNNTQTGPYNYTHGTSVASVISAKINNLIINGVAGGNNSAGVQIIPVKILDQISNTGNAAVDIALEDSKVDDAIIYAVNQGAKIINMSFKSAPSNDIQAALIYAVNNNVLLVSGAGNEGTGSQAVVYPANQTQVIAVSSQTFNQGDNYSSLSYFSSRGTNVDIAARGQDVCALTTDINSTTGAVSSNGTSYASPYVAGTAALMLSANSCLSPKQIWEVIKNTASKEGARWNTTTSQYDFFNYNWSTAKPGHSQEFGYGLIDANKAVKTANYMYSATKDLYLKDSPEDYGLIDYNEIIDINPNYPFGYDQSPDIWVRNADDGLEDHQNPEYNTQGAPVWVYVRVRNKGCVASSNSDILNVYWSKAASWTSWPQNWDGTDPTKGNLIGSISLGVIQPGEEKVFKFAWNLTTPVANNGWKSCVLARIVSQADPITDFPNRHDRTVNENNNVAIRNCTIVDIIPNIAPPIINGHTYPHGGYMYLSNPLNSATSYSFRFEAPASTYGNLIQEAEVTLKFEDENDWNFMVAGGLLNTSGIEQIREHEVVITNENVVLEDLAFPPNKYIPVYVGFSFLTDEITNDENYLFRVSQMFSDSIDQRLGSETYVIRKYPRNPFQADAGPDQIINNTQSANLVAQPISENAVYRWYSNDSLINVGSNLQVSPANTSSYKLEVIANSDGFKDYDEVEVRVRKGVIQSIFPNPTNSSIALNYQLENVTSASIIVTQPLTYFSQVYQVDVFATSLSLNLANFASGVYNIILVCDGSVLDVKNIQKL